MTLQDRTASHRGGFFLVFLAAKYDDIDVVVLNCHDWLDFHGSEGSDRRFRLSESFVSR